MEKMKLPKTSKNDVSLQDFFWRAKRAANSWFVGFQGKNTGLDECLTVTQLSWWKQCALNVRSLCSPVQFETNIKFNGAFKQDPRFSVFSSRCQIPDFC